MTDLQLIAKARRETMRWLLLVTANVARPVGIYTEAMLPVIQATYPDCTHAELRQQLDYLRERELVRVAEDPTGRWFVKLTREGVDLVEYTTEMQPGIARPRITAGG